MSSIYSKSFFLPVVSIGMQRKTASFGSSLIWGLSGELHQWQETETFVSNCCVSNTVIRRGRPCHITERVVSGKTNNFIQCRLVEMHFVSNFRPSEFVKWDLKNSNIFHWTKVVQWGAFCLGWWRENSSHRRPAITNKLDSDMCPSMQCPVCGGVPLTPVHCVPPHPRASQPGSSITADRAITGRGYLTVPPMELTSCWPTNIVMVQRLRRWPPARRWLEKTTPPPTPQIPRMRSGFLWQTWIIVGLLCYDHVEDVHRCSLMKSCEDASLHSSVKKR